MPFEPGNITKNIPSTQQFVTRDYIIYWLSLVLLESDHSPK